MKNNDDLLTPADRLGLSRRRFMAAASATASAAALSACATGGAGGGEGGDVADGGAEKTDENPFGMAPDATVDVVIFKGGYGDQYAKDAGAAFKELHPESTPEVSSTVNIQPELQPRFVGGNPPDLFDNSGAQSIPTPGLISEEQLAEISALIEAPGLDGQKIGDTLLPGVLETGTFGESLLALNYVYTVYGLWYSQKQFEEKGWDTPTTWDQVMDIGDAAKADGTALFAYGGQNASSYYMELALSMAIKQGGLDVRKKLDSLDPAAFEDPAVVQAYDGIKAAVDNGFFLPGGAGVKHTDAQTSWVTGKSVLYPSGSWIENEQKGITPDGYAMVGIPAPVLGDGAKLPVEAIHSTAGEPFFVPAQAANGAGGLEFLRVMLSKEQCQNFSSLTSSITIVKDTIPEDAFGSTALKSVDAMIKAAGDNVFTYRFSEWYPKGPELITAWTEFLNGDTTAEQIRETQQGLLDSIREDDSIEKYDVK